MKIRQLRPSAISVLFGLTSGSATAFGGQVHEIDPAKVVGATECGACHKYEVAAWKLTPY